MSPPPVRGVRRKKRNGPRVSPFLAATSNSDMAFPNCPSPAQAIPAPRAMPSKVLGVSREPQKPRARGTPKAPLPGGTGTLWPTGRPAPCPSHPCVSFPRPLSPDSLLQASSPPQVFGVCSISIPCLLFMKGKRSVCRILSGSGSFGGRAANPPTSAAYVILVPGSLRSGPHPHLGPSSTPHSI